MKKIMLFLLFFAPYVYTMFSVDVRFLNGTFKYCKMQEGIAVYLDSQTETYFLFSQKTNSIIYQNIPEGHLNTVIEVMLCQKNQERYDHKLWKHSEDYRRLLGDPSTWISKEYQYGCHFYNN